MKETITGIRLLECHVEKLDHFTKVTGFNRSEIIRRLVEVAEVVPAQFNATIQPPTQKRRRRREQQMA